MSKLGFRFAKVPTDRHPEWFEVSLEARCLGLELYVSILDWRTGLAEVAVAERWALSLCKLLRVEPEDRRAACRMLEALERRGLLVIENGKARVVFRADEDLGPRSPDPRKTKDPSDEGQNPVRVGSEWGQSGVNRRVTPSNDSLLISQIEEREENRPERETRAREGRTAFSIGSDLMLSATGRFYGEEWRHQLERIGMKPDAERRAVLASIQADPWCVSNVRVDPGHVLKQWPKYAAGNPPLKSVVRAAANGGRYAGPSEVAKPEEYAVKGEIKW